MKKILLILFYMNIQSAIADNTIYKCTSTTGEITYQNNSGEKNECLKTNFASFPNINIFKLDEQKNKKNNNGTNHNTESDNMTTNNSYSDEQKIRDGKRALILSQELTQENEQLNTVSSMLKNLKDSNSKDTTQLAQLEDLKKSHENNIVAIKKELGNTKIIMQPQELQIEKTTNTTTTGNINNQQMLITKATAEEKKPESNKTISNNTTNASTNNKFFVKQSLKTTIEQPIKIVKKELVTPLKNDTKNSLHKENSLNNSIVVNTSGLQSMPKPQN